MSYIKTFAAIVVVAFAAALSPAAAETPTLTAQSVENFVASLPAVDKLGDRLAAEGKDDAFNTDFDAMFTDGETKEFKPLAGLIPAVKELGEYDALAKAVAPHGFATPEAWVTVGDRVIATYAGMKLEKENPEIITMVSQMSQMPQMPAGMMDALGPETAAQMGGAMAILQSLTKVSQADKDLVAKSYDALDAWGMGKEPEAEQPE